MYNPYSCWKKGIYYTNPNILGKNIDIAGKYVTSNKATNIIAESVSGINSTITESTEGINGIADRASDVVSLSSETYNKVQDNNNMADMLRDIVNKFMLE